MEGRYVYSNKPAPALVAAPNWNPETVEEGSSYAPRILHRNITARLSSLWKDISTICYEPQRLTKWSEIMRKVIG